MEKQSQEHVLQLILEQWLLHGRLDLPAPIDMERLWPLVQRNKLDPLLAYVLSDVDPAHIRNRRNYDLRAAYRRNLLHAVRNLTAGASLASALEREGIPCVGMRGPFTASAAYGDPGLRYSLDIDLLVPRHTLAEAWSVLEQQGFALRNPFMPRGYYRRYHLHWPLEHAAGHILCDLHWLLDHPCALMTVDYQQVFDRSDRIVRDGFSWRQPAWDHLFLLHCIHLGKHLGTSYPSDFGMRAFEEYSQAGQLRHWLDLGAIAVKRGDQMNWSEILMTAERWNVSRQAAGGILGIAGLFHVSVPDAMVGQAREILSSHAPLSARAACTGSIKWPTKRISVGGFRGDRLSEIPALMFPGADFLAGRSRLATRKKQICHAVKVAGWLVCAGVETSLLSVWVPVRRRFSA